MNKEILLESGEKVCLSFDEIPEIEFDKFVKINDQIIIGIMKIPPGDIPILGFWKGNGEYIGRGVMARERNSCARRGCS